MSDQKQYLIKLARLASEPEIVGTDQDPNFVYIILPPGQAPDVTALYTPHRSGFERYYGNLSAWTTDCDDGGTPTPTPGAPVFKDSFAPPGFVAGQDYSFILDVNDLSAVATAATGSTLTTVDFPVYPSFLTRSNIYGEPGKIRLLGVVSAGTASFGITVLVGASNGQATQKSFIIQPKVIGDPYMGFIYINDNVAGTDDYLQILTGPDSTVAPWLTITSAPAGYTDRNRQQLPEFDADSPAVKAVLGNKPSYWRKLLTNPPFGTYAGSYEINGKTKYWSFSITSVSSSAAIALTDAPPTNPGGGNPTPTIAAPVWPAISNQSLKASQVFQILIPINEVTYGAGQSFKSVKLLSGPADMGINGSGLGPFFLIWPIPANQPNGDVSYKLEVEQTDGQKGTVSSTISVSNTVMYLRYLPESNKVDIFQFGPTFTNATIKIEGPPGWGGAVGTEQPYGVKNFEKWEASGDGKSFAARYRGYKLNVAGQYIGTVSQDGQTLYFELVMPGYDRPAGMLELTTTKPAVSDTPAYYSKKTVTSLDEGGNMYFSLWKHVAGSADTPVSGAEYVATNAKTGTRLNSVTGETVVDKNDTQGDSYTLNVQIKLNGQVVATDSLPINDKSAVPAIAPVLADYAWTNSGHVLDFWIKPNGGTGSLEWSYEIVSPGGLVTPGPGGNQSGSVPYMALTAGDYGNGYTLKGQKTGMPLDNQYGLGINIWIRRVGTSQTWVIYQPPIPASGNVNRTLVYGASNGGIGSGPALQNKFVDNVIEANFPERLQITFVRYDPVTGYVWYHVNPPTTKYGQDTRTWLIYRNEDWYTYDEFNACPHIPRQPLRAEAYLVDTNVPFSGWRESGVLFKAVHHVNYI